MKEEAVTAHQHPRIPNVDLRRARNSMRLSQHAFAEAVQTTGRAMGFPNRCTKRLVQKWENGEHAGCTPDYLKVLQAVTGCSARELGFRALPNQWAISLAALDESEGASGAEDSAGDRAAEAKTAVPALPGTDRRSSDAEPAESMKRLRHAINNPSMVDSRAAALVELSTARLFDREHFTRSRLLEPTVEGHLATVTGLLTAARHEKVRQSLINSAGRSALLAGWLAFDRGDDRSAHQYWDHAISAAEGTLDTALLAASLVFQSYAAARRGDPASAWQLAHSASEHTPDDSRATACATSRVALYAAQSGEREAAKAAMERSLEISEGMLSPIPGDGGEPWTRSFDAARLLSSNALTTAVLKEPGAATIAWQAVDALGAAKVKSRAVVLAEAALTAAMVGELEMCLDYGREAATIARELDVSVAAVLLHEVIPHVMPHGDELTGWELLPELSELPWTGDLMDTTPRSSPSTAG